MNLKSLLNCLASPAISISVLFLPILTSCDNEFDLSNVNADITVGGDLKIPIGETEKLTLSRIIDETDQLYVDADGSYALSTNGKTDFNVIKVNPIHVKDFMTEPNIVELSVPLSGSTVVPQLHIDSDISTILHLNTKQDLPAEVERIDMLDITGIDARVIVKLLANDMSLISKCKNVVLNNFQIQFPKEVVFAEGIEGLNYDTNVFTTAHPYTFDANGEITETFSVIGLIGNSEIVNSQYVVEDDLECSGTLAADVFNVSGDDFDGFRLSVKFDIPEFDIVKMTGIVNPSINVDPQIIEFGELPDIVTDESTNININTLSLKASIDNPTGVPYKSTLKLSALDKNKNIINEQVTVNVDIAKAEDYNQNKRTNLFITNSETLKAPDGYVKVLVNNLNKLIGQIPEYIEIAPEFTVDKTQTHIIYLGKDYSTQVNYDMQMPFDFGEGSHIVYRESIDNLNSDIEDVVDKVTALEIYAVTESTLPFEAKLSITPIDINGRDMSDRLDYTPFIVINPGDDAATPQSIEMKFSEKVKGSFTQLDKIEFTVEGNTKAAVSVLKPTQYIKLRMTAHIPDGITITD